MDQLTSSKDLQIPHRFWENPPCNLLKLEHYTIVLKISENIKVSQILPLSQIKCCTHFVHHLRPRCKGIKWPLCRFSNSPWCLVLKYRRWTQCIKSHSHNCHECKRRWNWNFEKTLKSGQKTAKPKIFKNPPKIQFWSYCKKPYVKINQKSKTFQIFYVRLVWPQFSNSP